MATEAPLIDRVASAIAAAGWTQDRLAEILGLHQSGVSNRLHGKTAWRVDELDKLSRALDVSLSQLLGAEPSAKSAGNRVSAAPSTVSRRQISAGPTRRPKQPTTPDLNGKRKPRRGSG